MRQQHLRTYFAKANRRGPGLPDDVARLIITHLSGRNVDRQLLLLRCVDKELKRGVEEASALWLKLYRAKLEPIGRVEVGATDVVPIWRQYVARWLLQRTFRDSTTELHFSETPRDHHFWADSDIVPMGLTVPELRDASPAGNRAGEVILEHLGREWDGEETLRTHCCRVQSSTVCQMFESPLLRAPVTENFTLFVDVFLREKLPAGPWKLIATQTQEVLDESCVQLDKEWSEDPGGSHPDLTGALRLWDKSPVGGPLCGHDWQGKLCDGPGANGEWILPQTLRVRVTVLIPDGRRTTLMDQTTMMYMNDGAGSDLDQVVYEPLYAVAECPLPVLDHSSETWLTHEDVGHVKVTLHALFTSPAYLNAETEEERYDVVHVGWQSKTGSDMDAPIAAALHRMNLEVGFGPGVDHHKYPHPDFRDEYDNPTRYRKQKAEHAQQAAIVEAQRARAFRRYLARMQWL